MTLFEILGRNMMSAEATAVLGTFPALRPETHEPDDDGLLEERYLTSERDGLLIKLSEEGDILSILLMSEGKDGFAQFRGELPGALTFGATPADVLKTLGPPASYRPPTKVGQFEAGDLMRFDWPAYSVHFQFRRDRGGIELVTAMVAALVPGRSARVGR